MFLQTAFLKLKVGIEFCRKICGMNILGIVGEFVHGGWKKSIIVTVTGAHTS